MLASSWMKYRTMLILSREQINSTIKKYFAVDENVICEENPYYKLNSLVEQKMTPLAMRLETLMWQWSAEYRRSPARI